jgi:hypothetical protein
MTIGGELHADEEAIVLEWGSKQEHLWGINLYPSARLRATIEFDSMINIRRAQGNRSRDVEDNAVRMAIADVVSWGDMSGFSSPQFLERWHRLSVMEQLGNIGSEMERVIS